jgi:hypothetical protein
MSDQKIHTAAKKPALALLPWRFLLGVARVFMYGAKKYAPGNWYSATLSDGAGERYVSATQRHLSEMQEPNGLFTPKSLAALDEESGLPHIDHAICGLIMLRGILVKDGALTADPGESKAPPTRTRSLADKIADATRELAKKNELPPLRLPMCQVEFDEGGSRCQLKPGHEGMHRHVFTFGGHVSWFTDEEVRAKLAGPTPLPKGPLTWDDVTEHRYRPTPPTAAERPTPRVICEHDRPCGCPGGNS